MRGVYHEQVRPGVQQQLGLASDVAVDAERGGDAQPAARVDSGLVQRRAQRAGPGQDADAAAAGVNDRGHPVAAVVQQPEGALRVGPGRQRQQFGDIT